MSFEINGFTEGLPDTEFLALIMMDGSATMGNDERKSGVQKHLCAAKGFQALLDAMDYPQYENASISLAFFSANRGGVQIVSALDCHKPQEAKTYSGNTDLIIWDPFSPQNLALGMGGWTPLGSAVTWGLDRAKQWVESAQGQVQRRAVVYIMSDGMNNVGPDGRDEKTALHSFNAACKHGEVRLATIGYFQSEQLEDGTLTDPEEEKGRQLLRDLVPNTAAYFQSDDINKIVGYILSTTAVMVAAGSVETD
jgi:hypothetical protein